MSISLYYNIGRARLYNDYKNVMFIWRLRICHNPMSISPSLICYELLFTCLWLYILFCSIVIIFISEKIYRHWRKQCKQTYKLRLIIIKWQKKWLCSLEVSILQRQVFFFFFFECIAWTKPRKTTLLTETNNNIFCVFELLSRNKNYGLIIVYY